MTGGHHDEHSAVSPFIPNAFTPEGVAAFASAAFTEQKRRERVVVGQIRVASVPQGHVYVRHLADPNGSDDVVRLPDPAPTRNAGAAGAPWWPLAMLELDWVASHAHEFDVYHLHFGFDSVDACHLRRLTELLHAKGKPIVYTVHDLHNPHQVDRSAHDAALDVLIPAADALITLTPGAADEIARRWQRTATVIPHPHVVELDLLGQPRPAHPRPVVGIHLKSLRANMDPLPVLDVVQRRATAREIDLVIDVHTDVMTPGESRHDPEVAALLRRLEREAGIRVHVHDYYTDAQLWDYLRGLDLSVLAYRFGTHSGWLESCYDLGTRVLASTVGYYHDQHPGVFDFEFTDTGVDTDAINRAIDALATAPPWQAGRDERLAQRHAIAAAHHRIYDRVITERAR